MMSLPFEHKPQKFRTRRDLRGHLIGLIHLDVSIPHTGPDVTVAQPVERSNKQLKKKKWEQDQMRGQEGRHRFGSLSPLK